MSVLNAKRVDADQTSRPAASDLLCDIFFLFEEKENDVSSQKHTYIFFTPLNPTFI